MEINNIAIHSNEDVEMRDSDAEHNNQADEKEKRKLCTYNNKGYCKNGDQTCPFSHTGLVCDLYKTTGLCWRLNCRERHPKVCRYGKRCF